MPRSIGRRAQDERSGVGSESEGVATLTSREQSRWWFVLGAVATAVLGTVSTRFGTKELPSATAADARAVLSALSAVAILGLAMQLILVGILKDRRARTTVLRPPSMVPILVVAGGMALATAGAVVLFVDSSAEFEAQAAAALGIAVFGTVAAIPSRAILLGTERWRDLAVVGVLSALVRVVATAAATDDFSAIFAGVALGEVVAAGTAVAITSRTPRIAGWPADTGRRLRIGTAAAAGLALLLMLSSVSVGRFLGERSEVFNQSASVARLVFVLAFTVAFVFFPSMAREPIGSVQLRKSFHAALLLTTGAAGSACAAIMLWPDLFMRALSDDLVASVGTTRILALAFLFHGLAVVSLMQYIAHGSRFALLTWPLAIAMVGAQAIVGSPQALAWAALVVAALLLVVASIPALARVQPLLRPDVIEHPAHLVPAAESVVTVVIPSYNPGGAVIDTVHELLERFGDARLPVRIVIVSDGSTDQSPELLDALQHEAVVHIRRDANEGKGAALRIGFAATTTPLVAFVDADGDIPPGQLVEMVRIQQQVGADIVYGSKTHLESDVSISAIRSMYSRVYRSLTRHLFQLDIADTQTGIKVYSAPLVNTVLPVLQERGFALDLELFVAARSNGFEHFVEVPVTLRRQGGSTISLRSVIAMARDTARIFWRAKVTLRYLRTAAEARIGVERGTLAGTP